jgi:hypothetical protein
VKSPAVISPVFATNTARPVIPPKAKLLGNLKKYVPNAISNVLPVKSATCLHFSFMIFFSLLLEFYLVSVSSAYEQNGNYANLFALYLSVYEKSTASKYKKCLIDFSLKIYKTPIPKQDSKCPASFFI